MADIRSHRRILDTFTAPIERPLLRWLAERLPGWVTPDFLTGIGVVGGLLIFFGYWMSGLDHAFLWLASFGFVVNWFGDSLDGTVARVRHIERPVYGFYIDHAVDAYIVILIFLGLGFSPYVKFSIAAIALIGYMLLSVLVYIRTAVKGEFAISYGRLGPTEVRLIGISANTSVFFVGNPQVSLMDFSLTVYDWVGIAVAALLYSVAILTTISQGRLLSNMDRQAKEGAAPAQETPILQRKGRKRGARTIAAGRVFAKGQPATRHLSAGKPPGQHLMGGKTAGQD